MKILLLLLLLLSGCGALQKLPCPDVKPCPVCLAPEKPQPIHTIRLEWDEPEWTKELVKNIQNSKFIHMKLADAKLFGVHDVKSWAKFFVEIAKLESYFHPDSIYREPSLGLYSVGLFQLSVVDGQRYGCEFYSIMDVKSPIKNIRCVIKVFDRLLGQDGRIAGKTNGHWKGAARYFSTLRAKRKLKQIIGVNL